ncbi:hypothetical protein Misp01_67340 [Microtetraspora sp. NBRC 13810]|uniref:hypothetical protein n=1 Tax=Microtetraspora sp. NBRC 13810 TaxID=3030990 RepID=UPI0024A10C83|nr:hypothetical protein [Microtetraspora sp. NBRC 13810]GLW11606.1 hypothetical protein Misp01_67340 [Microtetraspora sp. NBRC 13810]
MSVMMDDPMIASGFGVLGLPPMPNLDTLEKHVGTLTTAAGFHQQLNEDGTHAYRLAGVNQGAAADAANTYLAGSEGALPQTHDLGGRLAHAAGGLGIAGGIVKWIGDNLAALAVGAVAATATPHLLPRLIAMGKRFLAMLSSLLQKVGRFLRALRKPSPVRTRLITQEDATLLTSKTASLMQNARAITRHLTQSRISLGRAEEQLARGEKTFATVRSNMQAARAAIDRRVDRRYQRGDYTAGQRHDYLYTHSRGLQNHPVLHPHEQATLKGHLRTLDDLEGLVQRGVKEHLDTARKRIDNAWDAYFKEPPLANTADDAHRAHEQVRRPLDLSGIRTAHDQARDMEERRKTLERDIPSVVAQIRGTIYPGEGRL